MLVKEVAPYREFNRRRQTWRTAESLDELKEDLRVNGFQSPVMLATDPYHIDTTCTMAATG